MSPTSTTRWTCTNCWCAGKITYDSHADTWTVFQQLVSAHFAASPDCRFDDDKVRVQLLGSVAK